MAEEKPGGQKAEAIIHVDQSPRSGVRARAMTWPLIFALAIWSPAAVVMPATVAPSTSQVVHSG